MCRLATIILLLASSCISFADDWELVPSNDSYWIKTVNPHGHELLIAYKDNIPHFLLILATDSPQPDRPVPIWLKIDRGIKEKSQLHFLKQHTEQSIFRIEVDSNIRDTYIKRMIAGLKWSIFFSKDAPQNKSIAFSLRGFTVALNDLLIANEIGSLDQEHLQLNRKSEYFCYNTSTITIDAIKHRLNNASLKDTLIKLKKTDYKNANQHLESIVNQVYSMPAAELPSVPGAEKYVIFKRCMNSQ